MKMQYFVPTLLLQIRTPKLFLALMLVSFLLPACEFLDKKSLPTPPKDNPGINASLPSSFARNESDNAFQMLSAQKQSQICPEPTFCIRENKGHINYNYDINNYLISATERETGPSSSAVSHRRYFYDVPNIVTRLDKVAVSDSPSGSFHTLHDYTYDDENDGSYAANELIARPKLRKEYICDIDAPDFTSAEIETCDRLSATSVISYIYYASGYLYRKEFDVNNNGAINHVKVYIYDRDNMLIRVDTDNYYDGVVDERYTYDRSDNNTLRTYIDRNYFNPRLRGTNISISYRADSDLGNTINKECYFEHTESFTCQENSLQEYHWEFEWVPANCWAGGLDDIDPEARAINYLCKEGA